MEVSLANFGFNWSQPNEFCLLLKPSLSISGFIAQNYEARKSANVNAALDKYHCNSPSVSLSALPTYESLSSLSHSYSNISSYHFYSQISTAGLQYLRSLLSSSFYAFLVSYHTHCCPSVTSGIKMYNRSFFHSAATVLWNSLHSHLHHSTFSLPIFGFCIYNFDEITENKLKSTLKRINFAVNLKKMYGYTPRPPLGRGHLSPDPTPSALCASIRGLRPLITHGTPQYKNPA
jgi:hypothetical protein